MDFRQSPSPCPLPLRSLNHISLLCKDVDRSRRFYRDVLGFFEIRRPSSFDFEGCWLFGHGFGVHLIHGKPVRKSSVINPSSDHLSFQSDSLDVVKRLLERSNISFVCRTVLEDGVTVSQVFFHDPDNNMIEICNCDCLPVVRLIGNPNGHQQACGMCDPQAMECVTGSSEAVKH